jgi:anti-sigma B factor antagonist
MTTMSQENVATGRRIPVHSPDRAIDITNSGELRDAMLEEIESGARTLIVDLEAVRYVDSSGLSSLVHVATTIEKRQGHILLCGLDTSVRKVLEMTRLTEYFEIVDDMERARARAMELDSAH